MKHRLRSVALDSLCDIEYGTRVTRKRDAGSEYPVYGGGGKTFYIDKFNRESVFIVSRFGMSENCTRFVSGKFFLNDSGLSLSSKKEYNLLNDFLGYQLLHRSKDIYNLGRGTAQKNLDVKNFRKMKFKFVDSLDEQKRIVKKLDTCMERVEKAIQNVEQNIQNAEDLFQSKLNEMLSQEGDDWTIKNLGEVCTMIKRGIAPKYIDGDDGLTVINQKCIRNHKVDFSLSRKHNNDAKPVNIERIIIEGDVLVNSTGVGTLGRVAQIINLPKERATIDTHVTVLRPKPKFFVLKYFGFAIINLEKQIQKSGQGSSGQTELSRLKLQNNFSIRFPLSIEKQNEIAINSAKIKSDTKKLQYNYQQELDALDKLKQSILEKAFNGEL